MKRRLGLNISIFLSIWMAIGVFCSHIFIQPVLAASITIDPCASTVSDSNIKTHSRSSEMPNCCLSDNGSSTDRPGVLTLLNFESQIFCNQADRSLFIINKPIGLKCELNPQSPPGINFINTTILRE